jgi:purine catabolism regulator
VVAEQTHLIDPARRHGAGADALAGYQRADLLGAVAAYLRRRGRWEDTARDLAIHRNSLRHRIAVAQRLLGVSLDDPDTAAHLWLALRRRGH